MNGHTRYNIFSSTKETLLHSKSNVRVMCTHSIKSKSNGTIDTVLDCTIAVPSVTLIHSFSRCARCTHNHFYFISILFNYAGRKRNYQSNVFCSIYSFKRSLTRTFDLMHSSMTATYRSLLLPQSDQKHSVHTSIIGNKLRFMFAFLLT